jgi:hypothetical protein
MTVDRQRKAPDDALTHAARHTRVGWWALFIYTGLGLALEALHAFKAPTYLAVSNETRRLMWTLAHAHGTLVALLNIAYGVCLRIGAIGGRLVRVTSPLLLASLLLLPLGFFVGGVQFYNGDPGVGAALVPLGAAALLGGLLLAAIDRSDGSGMPEDAAANARRRGK